MTDKEVRTVSKFRLMINVIESLTQKAALFLLALIVVTVSWQVIARYVTTSSTAWAPELAQLCFVWLSLLAIALGVRSKRHMMLDIWSGIRNDTFKRCVNLVSMAVVVAVCGIFVWYGISMLETSFSRELPGLQISAGWIYLAIPVGFGLSLLFSLEGFWDDLRASKADDVMPSSFEVI